MPDRALMEEAIRLAIANIEDGGGPFAAVVACEGRIVARGANRVTAANDPTAHAEIVAIREACRSRGDFRLSGCEIYTTCEPCPMCLGAIYWARLDRVYYAAGREDAAKAGFDDSLIYREIAAPPASRLIPMTPLLRQEALACFDAWRQYPGRVTY